VFSCRIGPRSAIYPFAVEAGEDVGDLLNPFAVEAGETVEDLLDEGNSGHFDQLKAALDRQFRAIGITVGDLRALEPTEFFTQGSGLYGGVRVDLADLELREPSPGPAATGGSFSPHGST
jgi:hypothetical protein